MLGILPAMGAGASAGGILLLFSHIAPRFGAGNFVRDIDRPMLLTKVITRREAHFVGILVHIILSMVFGGAYALLVLANLIPDFGILPILGWGVIMTLVTGGIILPIEGHGLFGFKEDMWFPVDLLVTNILWSVLFWWLIRVWLGFAVYFSS